MLRQRLLLLLVCCLLVASAMRGTSGMAGGPAELDEEETAYYSALFTRTALRCPTELWEDLNRAIRELDRGEAQRAFVEGLHAELLDLLPVVDVAWRRGAAVWTGQSEEPLRLARGVARFVIVRLENRGPDATFRARFAGEADPAELWVPSGARYAMLVSATSFVEGPGALELELGPTDGLAAARTNGSVSVPVLVTAPASLIGVVRDAETGLPVPARVWVRGSDGVYRHGWAQHADVTTLTEKQVFRVSPGLPEKLVYYRLPFFYSGPSGQLDMQLPPGPTQVRIERGFEHQVEELTVFLAPGETEVLNVETVRFLDMLDRGWVSGETHVHWSINARYEDEDYALLPIVQRAEDVRVVNNLTMRGSHPQAPDFLAPDEYPIGLLYAYADGYLCYQAEEWRNNGGYGHLNLLNVTELVPPVASGPELMYLLDDQYDWPMPSFAVDLLRDMSNVVSGDGLPGVAVAAHGLHGWVIADLALGLVDALDQMEAHDYYKVLDCGFQVPITMGADHPARTVGQARTYVELEEGEALDYGSWVAGVLAGRTFVTSGPLLFLRAWVGDQTAGVGGSLDVSSGDLLEIEAECLTRDLPEHHVGRLQIVSNGALLADVPVNGPGGTASVQLPVGESRWLVARTTPPGAAVFDPLESPGVAHTSAIFVHADGAVRVVADPDQLVAFRDVCLLLADKVATEELLALQFSWQRGIVEQHLRDAAAEYDALIALYPGD